MIQAPGACGTSRCALLGGGAALGEAVTRRLLFLAEPRFRRVRLRAGDSGAARMYERCGFGRVAETDAAHALRL